MYNYKIKTNFYIRCKLDIKMLDIVFFELIKTSSNPRFRMNTKKKLYLSLQKYSYAISKKTFKCKFGKCDLIDLIWTKHKKASFLVVEICFYGGQLNKQLQERITIKL